MIRLLLCDASAAYRNALRDVFSEYSLIEVVGDASNDLEACALVEATSPDIVLMDVDLTPMSGGVETTRRITERWPWIRVLALVVDVESATTEMIEAGACGVCLRDGTSSELYRAVTAARTGHYLDERAIGHVLQEVVQLRGDRRTTAWLLSRTTRALNDEKQAAAALAAGVVQALVNALAVSDGYTGGHVSRVATSATLLTERVAPEFSRNVAVDSGYLLHDIGKLAIPSALLTKPGPLDPEERAVMETHVRIGAALLAHIPGFELAREIVAFHHERWDGTGYPVHLVGEQIPLTARIFAICDSYDAMTSDRAYRPAISFAEARRELERGAGSQFDPALVPEFLQLLDSIDLAERGASCPSPALPRLRSVAS